MLPDGLTIGGSSHVWHPQWVSGDGERSIEELSFEIYIVYFAFGVFVFHLLAFMIIVVITLVTFIVPFEYLVGTWLWPESRMASQDPPGLTVGLLSHQHRTRAG